MDEAGRCDRLLLQQPSAEEATGRFRPTTQVVLVDIAILDRGDRPLVPGMSATVRIHRYK